MPHTHETDLGDTMARKKPYYAKPPQGFVAGAPAVQIKAEFARVLQKKMMEKNWNQSDVAREAAKHMPDGTFLRDNVSQYVRGLSLPGTARLSALAKAFRCKPEDLLPVRSTETIDQQAPPLDMRALPENGMVFLRINQVVRQNIALKIIALLTTENEK